MWWRNNLRIHDNLSLLKASQACDELIHVYFWDDCEPNFYLPDLLRRSEKRNAFLAQSLDCLNKSLNAFGSQLFVLKGDFQSQVKALHESYPFAIVFSEEGICHEEVLQEGFVRECSGALLVLDDVNSLYPVQSLPFEIASLPDVFSSFRKLLEKSSVPLEPCPEISALPPCPQPNLPNALSEIIRRFASESNAPDVRAAFKQKGGEMAALSRLNYYLWESNKIQGYKETRNGLLGEDYSSKLAPFLSVGSLSARKVYAELKRYEASIHKNQSTYWLFFELLWREYFRLVARKYGRAIFLPGGIKKSTKTGRQNKRAFDSWAQGTTGDRFVDANMKELLFTGYMSNRGRQNVASYLIHDLGLDWTWGAAFFEHHLIDYDPHSNYGNWMYIAGVGNDPRENRRFDTRFQAERYDPDSNYQNLWLNE